MAVAEAAFEQPAAEKIDDVSDDDLLRRPGQSIAAFLAARRLNKPAFAEDAEDLRGICRRDAFRLADLRNRQRLALEPGIRQTHQAADAVFFVGGQLHLRSLAIGMMSSM